MTKYFMTKQQPKLHRDQDPGTTQPEGNSTHLNYKFLFFFFFTQIFPVLVVNSLCKNIFLIYFNKFPVFSLSGKMDFQIPCFPCAVATLILCPKNYQDVRSVNVHFPQKKNQNVIFSLSDVIYASLPCEFFVLFYFYFSVNFIPVVLCS